MLRLFRRPLRFHPPGYHSRIMSVQPRTRESQILRKLNEALNPVHIDLANESYRHNVPEGSETHFKVLVVSSQFEGLSLVQQHRLITSTLEEELATGVHALAIKTVTPEKWQASGGTIAISTPQCLGGSKK